MNFIPPGTTWLDVVTLLIALSGVGLAIWRYRAETRVGIRVEVGWLPMGADGIVVVVMTNTERRTVTVERAGITSRKSTNGVVFERWHDVNIRRGDGPMVTSDPALPKTLDPGSAPYGVRAGIRSVKSAFHPALPTWAFCVDTYRNTYWGQIPEDVQAAIRATMRRIVGPDDEYGHPTAIEIPDDAAVEQSALYD